MVWNNQIGNHAQEYTNTCPMGHNPNRNVGDMTVGENWYWAANSDASGSNL